MIEVLEQLLEARQNQEALELAEELLRRPANTGKELLAIQTALLRARAKLGQYESAIGAGRVALELAHELAEWDYYGVICLFLGVTYGVLQQYETAIKLLKGYLSHLPLYVEAAKHNVHVLYNLGLFSLLEGDSHGAFGAFSKALELAKAVKWERGAQGIKDAIADQYLKASRLAPIPSILASANVYLSRNVADPDYRSRYLFHQDLRARYAMQTGRTLRTEALALRGLRGARQDSYSSAVYHMILASLYQQADLVPQAVLHASATRFHARRVHRSELETEAATLVHSLLQADIALGRQDQLVLEPN